MFLDVLVKVIFALRVTFSLAGAQTIGNTRTKRVDKFISEKQVVKSKTQICFEETEQNVIPPLFLI